MRLTFSLGVAAALLLAAPAIAQDVSADPSLSLSGEASTGPANNGPLDAQITGDNSYGALIAAINAGDSVDLSGVTDENKVSVVLVSTLEGDAAVDGAALDAALTAHGDVLTALRANATANAAISAKLAAEGHALDDLIAIRTDANGNVLVFVDDRP